MASSWPIHFGLVVAISAWFAVSIWEERLARAKFNDVAGGGSAKRPRICRQAPRGACLLPRVRRGRSGRIRAFTSQILEGQTNRMRVINVALRGAPPFVVLYLDIDDIKDDLLLKEVGGAPQGCRGARRITGLEALIRWNHKTRNLLTPPAFIPIAERIGTAHPLGNWVLGESCRQLKLWHMEGIAPDVRRSVQGQLRAGARGGCKPVALGH